jgi:hypothetical protein
MGEGEEGGFMEGLPMLPLDVVVVDHHHIKR